MFRFLVSFFLLFPFLSLGQESIPELLTESDQKFVVPFFLNSYPQSFATRPYHIGSRPGLEIGTSLNYKSLSNLQDRFSSQDLRDELLLTQLFIKKSLIYRFELTLTSTLSSFGTTQVSGFGGGLTMHLFDLLDSKILPVLTLHTNSMNFEDTLTFQSSGLQLILGKNFRNYSFKIGGDASHISSRFAANNNGRQITASNRNEKNSQTVFTYFGSVQLEIKKYSLTLTQNYIPTVGWNPGVTLSYNF